MNWTGDMDELLRKHHKAGLSASISANLIAAATGRKLTRNAVIGCASGRRTSSRRGNVPIGLSSGELYLKGAA